MNETMPTQKYFRLSPKEQLQVFLLLLFCLVNEEIGDVNATAFVILQMMSDTNSQLKIPAFWNTAANGRSCLT